MTTLCLVRHAAAEEGGAGKPDAQRALTSEGIRKFRRAAQGIVKLLADAPPALILSSPYLRARQTAEILREAFDHKKIRTELRLSDVLLAADQLPRLLQEARAQPTLAVGHEPIVSQWVGALCLGGTAHVEFKKGAMAVLELSPGPRATLLNLLQPAVLREIG